MITIVTDILDLFFMVIEVAKRANSVVLLSGRNIPKSEVPIITTSDNISIFIWVPLKWISFGLVSGEHKGRVDFDSSSFKGHFIKDMNLS